tara:strand:- start:84 stop:1685 length:1602 start_codon:yes stop_codon:yes gene_type:complete
LRKFNINTVYKYDLIIFFLILFIFSSFSFYNTEPGIDQIRQISWTESLVDSKYFINFELIKEKGLIYLDEKSFFINLFRTSYSDIGNVFNIFPILLLYLLNFTTLSSIIIFNLTSIFFFSLNTIVAYLIFEKIFSIEIELKKNKFLKYLLFITLIPPYLLLYFPLGIHNISLFFFLLTFLYLIKFNKDKSKYSFLILLFLTALGIYSHKLNAVLIPSMIMLNFLFLKNYKLMFNYIISLLIIILPVIIIILLYPETFSSTKKFAEIDISFFNYLNNLILWPTNIIKTNGIIIFLFFIFGLFYLKKNNLILITLIIHIVCYIIINSFSTYFIRTNLYITYFILIVGYYGFCKIYLTKNAIIKFLILLLFFAHLILNFATIIGLKNNETVNYIYKSYYNNNGSIERSLNEISQLIKENDKLIYFDNQIEDYFKIYQKKIYKENSLKIKPIKNLLTLHQFQEFPNLNLIKENDNILLLSLDSTRSIVEESIKKLNKNYKYIFNNCALTLKIIYSNKPVSARSHWIYLDSIKCIKDY